MQGKMKKGLSLLLTVVLTLGVFAVGLPGLVTIARADTWDGTSASGDSNITINTSSKVIHIKTAKGFAYFAEQVRKDNENNEDVCGNYSDYDVYLDTDIDLNNRSFSGIGQERKKEGGFLGIGNYTCRHYFHGRFYGQNHTISNIYMSLSGDYNKNRVGLFRYVKDTTIQDLTLSNVSINGTTSDYAGFGALIGFADGTLTINNVHVNGGSVSGRKYVGGLVGEYGADSSLILTNCSNTATVTSSGDRAGGLVGHCKGYITATNCSNSGNVTAGSSDGGGIVAYIEDDHSIFTNCTNSGTIIGPSCAGGIFGYLGDNDDVMEMYNNVNTGNVTSSSNGAGGMGGSIASDGHHIFSGNINRGEITANGSGADAGGILGYNEGFGTFTNNRNYGKITSNSDNAGGILGDIQDDMQTFEHCYNMGNVTGSQSIGGIFGCGRSSNAFTFTNCGNSGVITSTSLNAGGIMGHHAGNACPTFTECWNICNIKAYNDAGGISGHSTWHTYAWRCWNAGNVETYNHNGNGSHGGLIGYTGDDGNNSDVVMQDCYNWGAISGAAYNAGLVAYVNGGKTYNIKYSYNAGSVSGNNSKAIISYGGAASTGCWYDSGVSMGTVQGTAYTDSALIASSGPSSNFCKNTWGVKIGNTIYYYPILTWYRNMFTFTSVFQDTSTNTNTTIEKTVYNNTFTTPNPTRTGYTIGTWYNIDNSAQTLTPGATVTAGVTNPMHQYVVEQSFSELTQITNTTTYNLTWTAHSYTVTFDGNGATSGSMNPQGFTYDQAQALTANDFSRAYTVTYQYNDGATANTTDTATATFNGWATSAGGAKVYNNQQSVSNLTATDGGNVPLYANWTLGSVTLPTPAARTTHAFVAWCTDSGLSNQLSGSTYTPTANARLYAKWLQVVTNDSYVIDFGLPIQLNVVSNDLSGVTLASVTGGTGFTTAVSGGKVLFTPTAALNAPVTFTYTVTYNGADYTASVTVIPANNVYYEESFFTFVDGNNTQSKLDASWTTVSDEEDYSALVQNGLRPGDPNSPVYGFDSAYNSESETIYSLGTAQYVEVSADHKGGATATFTFSGTGFDFYSVTDNESGLAFVDIYKIENGVETEYESTLINTYFGYRYGQLYLKNDVVTLDSTGTPIYLAPAGQTDGTFFVNGETRGWTSKSYYDTDGKTVIAGELSGATPAYAYGWVAGSNEVDGVYQVPVISRTGLPYGTYKVVIEPRWSARQNLTGGSSYRFYVDAVRVYNPIDPSTITSGTATYDAYIADSEYGATWQSVRDLLITANSFGNTDGHGTAGVAFLEPGTEVTVANYKNVGPKNEVYLEPGQAIAFNLTTAAQTTPAKLSVGLKMAKGTTGSITVYSKDTTGVPITVNGATELYRDITAAVAWQATTGSACTTSAPIIIANTSASNSGAVISITNLKWSYNTEVTPVNRMLSFSFAPQDLVTASAVMRQAAADTVAPDASGVQLQWNARMIRRGGVATLAITAPATFEKAYVNGAEVAGYTENADGTRTWRYDFTSARAGKHAFDVRLADANGYMTKTLSAGEVEVVESTNGQGTLTLQALLARIFNSFFEALRNLFRR
ncbi:MAG: InlB B-repeat-containing protein [Clostridia bacterium]|nr:InlB B-repeat-containing protein [Clostridia bacterium]